MVRNLFFKNFGKKFVAFIAALLLWCAANVEQDVERNIPVEISYENLPDNLIIMNKPPERLNARVRGPRNRLSSLSRGDVSLTLNLKKVSVGMSRFEVQTGQIKSPREIQIIGISPAEIRLEIDRLVEKQLKVKPVIGVPDTGYEIIGEPEITPSEVRVVGPEGIVSKLEAIFTDPVSATAVKSKFTIEVPLKIPPRVEVVGNDTVKVTVTIKERTVVKEFKDINIDLVNFDHLSFEPLEPLRAELEFEGPYSIIKDLNSNDIKVFIDGNEITKNNGSSIHKLEVSVDYPHHKSLLLKKKKPDEIGIKIQ
ncbi:MAG TPA: CdaR family protein [Thermodesulfobacteriota bacterium]|nr:CdaR family protein [Thermodesulfobacteriota bacterium]